MKKIQGRRLLHRVVGMFKKVRILEIGTPLYYAIILTLEWSHRGNKMLAWHFIFLFTSFGRVSITEVFTRSINGCNEKGLVQINVLVAKIIMFETLFLRKLVSFFREFFTLGSTCRKSNCNIVKSRFGLFGRSRGGIYHKVISLLFPS